MFLKVMKNSRLAPCGRNKICGTIYKIRAGTSLLIALGLTTILIMVTLGSVNLITSNIRESSARVKNAQAYYAAKGALETGLMEAIKKGTGYDSKAQQYVKYNEHVKAIYQIYGRVANKYEDGMYGIPNPGSGTVGADCDTLKAHVTGTLFYKDGKYLNSDPAGTLVNVAPKDNPCNWNKISPGETVTIPLYITENDGIKNPGDVLSGSGTFDITKLQVKVRTPCKGSKGEYQEMCDSTNRYVLDTFTGNEALKCIPGAKLTFCGDVIMLWQIIGDSKSGDKTYILNPNGKIQAGKYYIETNTEIHEYLINEAKNGLLSNSFLGSRAWVCPKYCVLYEKQKGIELNTGKKGSINNFLKNIDEFKRDKEDKINKPVLKLTVIHSLKDHPSKANIPYLEYQINVASSAPPADINQIVIAEGYSGDYKQTLQGNVPRKNSVIDYVVQQ